MSHQIQAQESIKAPGTTSTTYPGAVESPFLVSVTANRFSLWWETGLPIAPKLYLFQLLHLREIVLMLSLVLSSKVPGYLTPIRMDSI